jgi:hypothetical protein
MPHQPALLSAILTIGALAMSSAAIMIRCTAHEGVPSLAIVALRLRTASLVLAIPADRQHVLREYAKLGMRDAGILAPSGLYLRLHFATWISSFEHTPALSSVLLVTTTLLWIGFGSPLVLGRKRAVAPGLV